MFRYVYRKNDLENIKGTYTIREFDCSVGISIGIALYDHKTTNMDELLQQADKALYEMKSQGKGGYVVYHS